MLSVVAIILFGAAMILIGRTFKSDPNDADDFNMGRRQLNLIRVKCGLFSVVGAGELVIVSTRSA